VRNALSVDVEDWFQVGAFEDVISRADWDGLEQRVERNTEAVLELFDQAGVIGTFFTLAWVAGRYPSLIRKIADHGHEIASHGMDHKRVFEMDRAGFLSDVTKSKAILEDTSGQHVSGYRAPSFSIDTRTPWAHDALVEAGYGYSSSVAPIRHDHYGWPDSPRFAWQPIKGADFIELPVTTALVSGRRMAAGGGGFFRLLPYALSRWAIRQVNAEARPAIFYFHPWEIDPGQPRVANATLRSKLRHYTKLDAMAGKMQRLVRDFEWQRVDAIAALEKARLG
jgi:polysaccharide deacetylase family protein (PEP-CTERM system associated)